MIVKDKNRLATLRDNKSKLLLEPPPEAVAM